MENKDFTEEENESRTKLLEELREQVKEKLNRESESRVYLDIPCPVCGNKTTVAYAEDDRYCERCCWDYDGIADETEQSAINGTTIREYRLKLLNDLLQEKWERAWKRGLLYTGDSSEILPMIANTLCRRYSDLAAGSRIFPRRTGRNAKAADDLF